MIGALVYLRVHSAMNRVKLRLRRLRQPKYLVGGIVGMLYLWGFLLRNLWSGRLVPGGVAGPFSMPAESLDLLEWVGAWLLLLFLLGCWVLPSRRAALEFSPAEVQFLFPAPVSRRGLLHYKLASWQAGLLFASLMVNLFSGRLFAGHGAWMSVTGWWLVLFLMQLHSLGASFVRTALMDRGVRHWQRRAVVCIAVFGVLGFGLVWGWRQAPSMPGDVADLEAMMDWFRALSGTHPLAEMLLPFRWFVRLMLVRDPDLFLKAAAFAVAVIGLHYVWVMRATVAFEEASVDALRAADPATLAAQGAGGGSARPVQVRAGPVFGLRPIGPPWVALGWKNLLSGGDWFRGRRLRLTVLVFGVLLVAGVTRARTTEFGVVAGSIAGMLLGLSLVFGPAGMRMDLRSERQAGWEILKALPLSGREVVLGELMAPLCLLSGIQWGLSLVLVTLLPAWPALGDVGVWERAAVLAALMVVAPAVTLLGLCLQNAAVLVFPAWVLTAPGQARGGFEVMGQRMIVFAAQALAFALVILPAVLGGAIVFALASLVLGPWFAGMMAALAIAGVVYGEAGFGIWALGWLWDRIDLSRERAE